MKKRIKRIIFILPIFMIITMCFLYFFKDNVISKTIKFYIDPDLKQTVKDIFFYVPETLKKTSYLEKKMRGLSLEVGLLKNQINSLRLKKTIKNELIISKKIRKVDDYSSFSYNIPFHNYIISNKPAFYISITNDFVFLISGVGEIIKFPKKELFERNITPSYLRTNLNDIIKDPRHYDINKNETLNANISIKDSLIIGDNLFISYIKELKVDCYNNAIIVAKIFDNITTLEFNEFLTFDQCISMKEKYFGNYFWAHMSGGRMIEMPNNKLLLSIGDYRTGEFSGVKPLAQKSNSIFGKIIQIDLLSKNYLTFSSGHRNPQGLLFFKTKEMILATEHGPYGGDEINIIEKDQNYGWPISSYGRHYDNTYKKESPLHKSHKKYGFKEPLLYWNKVSQVGVSQIISLEKELNNNYLFLVGAMKSEKMFILSVNKNFSKAHIHKTININERVRDIVYDKINNIILLALENTPKLTILIER